MRPNWFENAVNMAMEKHKKTPSGVAAKEILAEIPDEIKTEHRIDTVTVSYHLRGYREDHKPKSLKTMVQELVSSVTEDDFKVMGESFEEKIRQLRAKVGDGSN